MNNYMKLLSLTLPGENGPIGVTPPPNIPSGANAPVNAINAFLALIMIVVVVAAVIFTAYGGVLWATSQGDKQKIDRARRAITYSIIGLIVMLLAFFIVQAVGFLLNSSYLTGFGKP